MLSGPADLSALTKNLVAEDAESIDLQFATIPAFEEPAELQAATVADLTGAEELARMDGLVLRNVSEDFLERE